jgi:hypothetical protein
MSTLRIRLEVAVNLALGTCVFGEYKEETEKIARILDVHATDIKEAGGGNNFSRAFKSLESKKRKFFSIRSHISDLKRRINVLYKAGPETILQLGMNELSELENWFKKLVGEHGYEQEYVVDLPWYQLEPATVNVEEKSTQAIA